MPRASGRASVRYWRTIPGVRAVKNRSPARTPGTRAKIKGAPAFADLPLVRQSRLSVSPVPEPAWVRLCQMAGVTP